MHQIPQRTELDNTPPQKKREKEMNSLIIVASYEGFSHNILSSAGNLATLENITGINALTEAAWVELLGSIGYRITEAHLEMEKEIGMGLKR